MHVCCEKQEIKWLSKPIHVSSGLFRGMPMAYHGKNPAGFVFICSDKLQN